MAESSSAGAAALPGVSYVMPVLNEAPYVRAAVERLLAQDYRGPSDITLAVADLLGRLFRIMPGSRRLARTLAALSSVANAPRCLAPPPCERTHQTPLPDPA